MTNRFFSSFNLAGLNSFQLLQTITSDQLDENGVSSADELTDNRKHQQQLATSQSKKHLTLLANELAADKSFNQWSSSSSSESSSPLDDVKLHLLNGSQAHPSGSTEVGVTPALRRRRERAERQRSLLREQEEASRDLLTVLPPADDADPRKSRLHYAMDDPKKICFFVLQWPMRIDAMPS